MRATLDIPDDLHRRAKARAAELRIPLSKFVSDAVAEKLGRQPLAGQKAKVALFGKLRHLRKETVRINALIEEEFERV